MANINRRRFLQSSSAMGFAAGTGLLAAMGSSNAFAADTSGYKALVCVFFKGGMDSMDLILPKDTASHDALAAIPLFDQVFLGLTVWALELHRATVKIF